MSSVRLINDGAGVAAWTDRLRDAEPGAWEGLREILLRAGWKPAQVDILSAESARVLRHLPDPLGRTPFQGRGLVVGYVQSGKTANYTALAARAVDAGYRVVIVLSGIHDALRNQTQARLERELVAASPAREWSLLTSTTEDFRDPGPAALERPGAFLVVAKKLVPILGRIDRWLAEVTDQFETLPVLLIDDEADQASINTRGNRAPDPGLDDMEEEPVRSPDGPSATNALIRSILSRLPKAAYVAYTATPFANIFIDPAAFDRRVGEDLFPRDFAIQLPRPEGYTGTEELFGVTAQDRDVFRAVPDDDVGGLKRSMRRRTVQIVAAPQEELLPDSLADAFASFCLAGAVRDRRPGLKGRSHTMLVHVSARVSDQARVAEALRTQRSLWLEAERQGHSLSSLFQETLERHFRGVELGAPAEAIVADALEVLDQLTVLELNSEAGENLEYETRPGRHLVAVGGNRLSRGLTLEGLTISYFLRTATMADSLLQMARWYGFRTGYEDLIRIWTTDEIAHWFTELALVEQSLRDSLQAMARAGRRPAEMAIRLRAHSGLLLTARNKASMAETLQESWSGEHPQTVILPLQAPDALAHNRALAENLLGMIGAPRVVSGGHLFQDVPPELVCDFLRLYRTHEDVVSLRGDAIADWIMQRTTQDELLDWSVFLAGAQAGRPVRIGPVEGGLVTRSRTSSQSIGILIDPRHEGVDLAGGPDAFRRPSGNYDSEAMRAARAPSSGLLILYPLDPEPLNVTAVDAVIGLGLSLPVTADGRAGAVVNRGVAG